MGIAFGVIAALRLVVVLVRNDAYDIAKYYMADDAFYYFQTARNLVAGLGSTFDGIHATNGYHPLWFLVTSAVFALVPGSTAPLMVIYALQVAMLITSGILLYLTLREIDPVPAAFTAALFLASNYSRNILFSGMESTLAFLLTSSLLLLAVRRRSAFFLPGNWRQTLGILALLLGVSLARLEAGLLAACWVAIAFVVDARMGGKARWRILFVALGLAAAACVYVATNLHLVGVPFPISGLIKSAGHASPGFMYSIFRRHRDAFTGLIAVPGQSHWAGVANAVASLVLALSLVAFLRDLGRRDPERTLALGPFLLFAIAFVAVSMIVTAGMWGWYLWPALLVGALATFALIRFALARLKPAGLGLGLLALATALTTAVSWVPIIHTRTLADWGPVRGFVMDATIRFIREKIPVDERIGGISSGIYTYFAGRQIENLEGLANGAAFYRARLNPNTYATYLRENHIRWIVFHTTYEGERAAVFDRFVPAGAIDRVYDLDSFYHLQMRRTHPSLTDPNVYFVRLRQ